MTPQTLAGQLIGPYHVETVLDRGQHAIIYLARHHTEGYYVALKVLPLGSDYTRARAWIEIAAVQRLYHPHIVRVFSYGVTDDFAYIAFAYIAGGTLLAYLQTQKITQLQACSFARQIAFALHSAHAHNIIHRDVKPANILLNGTKALLTDFGISRLLDMPGVTDPGMALGTPDYIAPEQAMGRHVNQRTDIYALGCVLYHMLAGMPPFPGTNPVEIATKHVKEPPPSLRHTNLNVPPALEAIVLQAMAKHPQDRYASAHVLATALQPFTMETYR